MDCRELRFWKDTYLLCRDVAKRARRGIRKNQPLWPTLHSAGSDVPVMLLIACLADDEAEIREAVLEAFIGLQMMTRLLFVLGLRGHIELEECCGYVERCASVSCGCLRFIREMFP